MRFQAGVQIVLIILAVVIVMTVIRPEFSKITINQEEISKYQLAVSQADRYNQHLQQIINKVANMPRTDLVALNRFMPSEVDSVRVARDIENIVTNNNMLLESVSVGAGEQSRVVVNDVAGQTEGGGSIQAETRRELVRETFSVTVVGTYENMKAMLIDIERNAYPLRVTKFDFTGTEDSILKTFSLELQSFALISNTQN